MILRLLAGILAFVAGVGPSPSEGASAPSASVLEAQELVGYGWHLASDEGKGTGMVQTDATIIIRPALVVAERERMGVSSAILRADVTDLLHSGGGPSVELRSGMDMEDYRERDRLLLILPAGTVNELDGHFVLSIAATGPDGITVRRARALRRGGHIAVQLEAKSGADLEGRWAYSRRPQLRKVTLASFDDPLETFVVTIFHAIDFQQAAVKPSVLSAEGAWARLEFELQPAQLEESRALDDCERLLEVLDAESGEGQFEYGEESLTEGALDRAAAKIESREATQDRKFNLTLEAAGRETTRGKRLQPLVRYPITLIRRDGTRLAATLGCSFSRR